MFKFVEIKFVNFYPLEYLDYLNCYIPISAVGAFMEFWTKLFNLQKEIVLILLNITRLSYSKCSLLFFFFFTYSQDWTGNLQMISLKSSLTKCLYLLCYMSCWTILSEFLAFINLMSLSTLWITTYYYYVLFFYLSAYCNFKKMKKEKKNCFYLSFFFNCWFTYRIYLCIWSTQQVTVPQHMHCFFKSSPMFFPNYYFIIKSRWFPFSFHIWSAILDFSIWPCTTAFQCPSSLTFTCIDFTTMPQPQFPSSIKCKERNH